MRDKKKRDLLISIVVPVFNEAENIEWHHNEMAQYLHTNKLRHEFIYVDDGSSDNTLSIIKSMSRNDKSIRYVSLSRNFGKESATAAGIGRTKGDVALIIDADGQHPISMLGVFLEQYQKGYDVVAGVRQSNTGEGFVKRHGSKLFYTTLRIIGGKKTIPGSTDFRLIDRKVINAFNGMTERNRVTRNLIDWLGFCRIEVPFDAQKRHAGEATYSTRKLFALAINGIVGHSTRPLKLIALLGGIISTISAGTLVFVVLEKLLGDPLGLSITGVAILAIFISFLVGIVLVCQGLLALYLESVYHETQNRPLYVITEES